MINDKERKYRLIHNFACVVVVWIGTGISFLAGAGELYILSQICVWSAIALQWNVMIRGTKRDRKQKIVNEFEEFADLLADPQHSFKHYTYLHPVARGWFSGRIDKLMGITHVHLWSYNFDLDSKVHEYESEIEFPVNSKQLFEMNLKGYIDISNPQNVIPALEYLNTERSVEIFDYAKSKQLTV